MKKPLALRAGNIDSRLVTLRGQRVMLDAVLAGLYGVETFNLNKAVQRNRARFPVDFMFRLSAEEWAGLKFQTGISNRGSGGRRYLPYAFTQEGIAMLSGVLRSTRAVAVGSWSRPTIGRNGCAAEWW